MGNSEAERLSKLFNSIIFDKQPLNCQNNSHFLEALYTSPDPAACVDDIINSPKGLSSLQSSLRMDISTPFINDTATKVVLAITAPEVSSIANGTQVQKVVMSIVEPPIFWGALLRAFQAGQLGPEAQKAFARLLLQMVMAARQIGRLCATGPRPIHHRRPCGFSRSLHPRSHLTNHVLRQEPRHWLSL